MTSNFTPVGESPHGGGLLGGLCWVMRERLFLTDCRRSFWCVAIALGISLGSLPNRAIGAGTPAFVQEKDNQVSSGKTVKVTFSSSTSAGNLIIAFIAWDNTGSVSLTDSSGNGYSRAVGPTKWHSNLYSNEVFYARSIAGGGDTITATFSSNIRSFGTLYVLEYSGLDATAPLDVTAAAAGSSGSLNSGSATTTSAVELLFGAGVSDGTVRTPGAGYTVRTTAHGDLTMDRNVSVQGTYSATAGNSGGAWAMQMVAFKAATNAAIARDTTAPTIPAGLSATAVSSSQINLAWTASSDADDAAAQLTYRIYRNGTLVATTAGGATSWSDTGLASATTYTYAIDAKDPAGNASAQSASVSATTLDTTAPTVPTGLAASTVSSSQINLSWTASSDVDNAQSQLGYRLYRNSSLAATVTGGATSWSDTGLTASTSYTYAVSAQDPAGNSSALSAAVSAKTSPPPLPAISSFGASPASISAGQATTLSWATANATSVSVDHGVGTVANAGSSTVSPSITTVYTLTAVNAYGTVTAQTTVTVSSDTQAPTVPANLILTAVSPSQINLIWSPSADNVGVAGYQVYRNGAKIGTTTATSYSDTGLAAGTTYTYAVAAYDAAGNVSALTAGAVETTLALSNGNYSTSFPLDENPISENGNWINGMTNGLDWADVRTAGGIAFGTESGSGGYDDSTAILTGTWGPNQTVQAMVHSVNQNPNVWEEVELRLRSSITADSNTGYEINFRCAHDGSQYVEIVRWNGALGDFSYIIHTTGPGLRDGDMVKASIVGNVITAYINGVQVAQGTDNTFGNGNPGMGFYLFQGTSDLNSNFGFTSFSATDGSAADTQAPTVPTNLTATAVSPSQVNLSWAVSADNVGVTGYQIYRNGVGIGATDAATDSDTGLNAGATYTYAVAAFDAAGNISALSATASATTPPGDITPPSVPTNLQSLNVGSNSATVAWTASTDDVAVAGYEVFRNGNLVATTAMSSYSDTGLSASTTYVYTVAAYDSSNNVSALSAPLSVTTTAAASTPPSFVQVSNNQISSGTSASVTFNSSTKAGNTIVAYAIWSNTGTVALSDTRGNIFVSAANAVAWGSGYRAQVFYATNIAGGTDTVTATFQTSVSSFGVFYVHEYAGINTLNPVDVVASATGSSSAMNSGSAVTTSPNDLVFGAGVSGNNVISAGSGFTSRSMAYGNITEDRTAVSAGSYSATATQNGTTWGMQLVAFRAAK